MIRFRYKHLVFLIIFTIPIRNVSLLAVTGANLRPGDLLLLFGVVVLLFQILTGRMPKVSFSRKLNVLLMLFVFFCFVSLVWAPDRGYGFARTAKYLRNLVLYVLLLFWLRLDYRSVYNYIIAGMVFSFSYILYTLIQAIIGGQISLSLLLSSESFTSADLGLWRSMDSSQATFSGTVNSLALWTAMTLILWFGTGLWLDKTRLRRWIFWGVIAVLLILELATLSRSVWLGLIAGAAWYILTIMRVKRVSPLTLVIAVLFSVGFVYALQSQGLLRVITGRLLSITTPSADQAINDRYYLWSNAVEIIMNYPILGLGIGLGGENSYFTVHNVYLQILAELGILGFLLFAGIFGTAIGMIRRSMKSCTDSRLFVLVTALMAAIIFYLVTGFTMADFTEMEIWIVLAMISALPYLQSKPGQRVINEAAR
jgi:O-antigen ligase